MRSRSRRLVPVAPSPTSPAVAAAMRGNKRTNTKPELVIRRLLHALGYRYRLHPPDLPGKPDIVFRSRRSIVQVHGCFWHQHPDPSCSLRSKPRSNRRYWNAKLGRNVERDRDHEARLRSLGWRVFTVWECQCSEPQHLTRQLQKFLSRS